MVTPIPITGATGYSYFYPGSVNAQQWGEAQAGLGERYWVESASAAKVTAVGAAARTVRIAAGRIAGHGVTGVLLNSVDLVLDNPASGTIYYTVVARRTWQASNLTTITAVAGTSARAIATTLQHTPGTIDDQPLALVQVTKDQNDVVVTDDLRAVGNKGDYEATSELVLGYMDKPGYRVRIAGVEWLRLMGGTWTRSATPVEIVSTPSAILTSEPGSSFAVGTLNCSLVRDGLWRRLAVEQYAADALTITAGASGNIADRVTLRLNDSRDYPAGTEETIVRYRFAESGSYTFGSGRLTSSGAFAIAALMPGLDFHGTGASGSYDLRFTLSYYAGTL